MIRRNCLTVQEIRFSVIHPGEYNRDSGPDFFNARISIAGTVWAGNVEIHTRSSHFDTHGHQNDPAFNNVILHVVAENDKKVFNTKGEEILTAELSFDPDFMKDIFHWLIILLLLPVRMRLRKLIHFLCVTGLIHL